MSKTNGNRPKPLSLKNFSDRRNKVLIWHERGGLGDVFMQRMLFEDLHKTMPDAELHLACLPDYAEAGKFHPYIHQVLDSRTVNPDDYLCVYNTCVSVVDRYEHRLAPYCVEHRSDIWAKYCGLTLQNHEMHLNLPDSVLAAGKERLEALRGPGKPLVAFAPVSKMKTKSLLPDQILGLVRAFPELQFVAFHKQDIPGLNIPVVSKTTITEWMGCIAAADYVVSVDTACFHLAGGLKKPLVGIYTWADGKTYGKHFDFVLVQKHRDRGNWPCGPCFRYTTCPKTKEQLKPCLTEITVEELCDGVRQMLRKWPSDTLLSQGFRY